MKGDKMKKKKLFSIQNQNKGSSRKSQTALEFLTTYAWAFLVILILIGALVYFGIMNPSKLLPDRCNFSPEIGCQYYTLTYGNGGTTSGASLKLKNNVGEHITTTAVTLTSEGGTSLCTVAVGAWTVEEVKTVAFADCGFLTNGLVQNEKAKVLLSITYYPTRGGVTYSKTANGDVYATVQ